MTKKLKKLLEQLKADTEAGLLVVSIESRKSIRHGVNWRDLRVADVYRAQHLDGTDAFHVVVEEAVSPDLEAALGVYLYARGWTGDVRVRTEWRGEA